MHSGYSIDEIKEALRQVKRAKSQRQQTMKEVYYEEFSKTSDQEVLLHTQTSKDATQLSQQPGDEAPDASRRMDGFTRILLSAQIA